MKNKFKELSITFLLIVIFIYGMFISIDYVLADNTANVKDTYNSLSDFYKDLSSNSSKIDASKNEDSDEVKVTYNSLLNKGYVYCIQHGRDINWEKPDEKMTYKVTYKYHFDTTNTSFKSYDNWKQLTAILNYPNWNDGAKRTDGQVV